MWTRRQRQMCIRDSSKGYGFITTEEGFDVFVHSSALNEGTSISDGDNVEFEVQDGERGKSATKVQKI